ncbi:MAG: glycerophosphodiester phosphodiesterase family protein [Tannerella sp.]|jgi:glycerophosphoryl diester phosphodiesterase|nr:glycerophosphodiester phosphodiesterase family protein [Tannerella sp.]
MKNFGMNKWIILFAFLGLHSIGCGQDDGKLKKLVGEKTDLHEFFKYKADGSIIISGHRGGLEPGFPENSLEGFENVLTKTPSFFEIDPRLTKDSVIVLMHDATLDRTTDGKGNLSDYTWAQLQSVRLKDMNGKTTAYKIPTLKDVILWSKGKTVVNLDKKDVPMAMIVELIKECDAENQIMLTVHTGAQARYYYDRLPNVMFSAFVRDDKEYEDMAISGVPWKNMIAYIGASINEKNRHIVEKLHRNGVRCMISLAPTHDKLKSAAERDEAYRKEIALKPDIIESDLPVEVSKTLAKTIAGTKK